MARAGGQAVFFPGSDRPEVIVSIFLPQGTSIGVTDATARRAEDFLHPWMKFTRYRLMLEPGAPALLYSRPKPRASPDPAFAKLVAVTDGKEARDRVMAAMKIGILPKVRFPKRACAYRACCTGPPVLIWPNSVPGNRDESDRTAKSWPTRFAM